MIDNLKYLPRKTIIKLFHEVFDQLPSILEEVAPNGWAQSAYYPLFHFSRQEKILQKMLHCLTKAQYQQLFGTSRYQKTDNVDFEPNTDVESITENFLSVTYDIESFNPEAELCSLFAEALCSICFNGKFFRQDSDFLYEINPPVAHKAAHIVARDKGIVTDRECNFPFVPWDKRILIREANLMPLMRYLFQALPKTDFTWEYLDYSALEFIGNYHAYQAGERDETNPYHASKRDFELGIESAPNLDDYFKQAQKELPTDGTAAYFDVFGEWPKGFPMDKNLYLEWYEKLNAGKR